MKSEGISKYDIHWQIVRVSLKGKLNQDVSKKVEIAQVYFEANPNKSRWERVLNWMQGLERGYKDEFKKNYMKATIKLFSLKPYSNELEPTADGFKDFAKYLDSQLYKLYLDLFKTNENWLKKGYFHKECNAFMDKLLDYLESEKMMVGGSRKTLQELREKCQLTPNTHKFLF